MKYAPDTEREKGVKMKLAACFFVLLSVLSAGCGHDPFLSELQQSSWYSRQLDIVRAKPETFGPWRSLWYGKVAEVRQGYVTLKPFRLLAGSSRTGGDALELWIPEEDGAKFAVGTWLCARTDCNLKNQHFVQEYRCQ